MSCFFLGRYLAFVIMPTELQPHVVVSSHVSHRGSFSRMKARRSKNFRVEGFRRNGQGSQSNIKQHLISHTHLVYYICWCGILLYNDVIELQLFWSADFSIYQDIHAGKLILSDIISYLHLNSKISDFKDFKKLY